MLEKAAKCKPLGCRARLKTMLATMLIDTRNSTCTDAGKLMCRDSDMKQQDDKTVKPDPFCRYKRAKQCRHAGIKTDWRSKNGQQHARQPGKTVGAMACRCHRLDGPPLNGHHQNCRICTSMCR